MSFYGSNRNEEGMKYGALPYTMLLDKMESTNMQDVHGDYDKSTSRAGLSSKRPTLYPPIHMVREGYDPEIAEDEVIDDIVNEPGEQFHQYVRREIEDRTLDDPLFEEDKTRRNPDQSRERLNLRFNSSRGTTDALPVHPEMFMGFVDADARGTVNDPDMRKMNDHLYGTKDNPYDKVSNVRRDYQGDIFKRRSTNAGFRGGRAARMVLRMNDNQETFQPDRPKTDKELSDDRQTLHITMRDKYRGFTRQREGMGLNNNVGKNYAQYQEHVVADESMRPEHSNIVPTRSNAVGNTAKGHLKAYQDQSYGDSAKAMSINRKVISMEMAKNAKTLIEKTEQDADFHKQFKDATMAKSNFHAVDLGKIQEQAEHDTSLGTMALGVSRKSRGIDADLIRSQNTVHNDNEFGASVAAPSHGTSHGARQDGRQIHNYGRVEQDYTDTSLNTARKAGALAQSMKAGMGDVDVDQTHTDTVLDTSRKQGQTKAKSVNAMAHHTRQDTDMGVSRKEMMIMKARNAAGDNAAGLALAIGKGDGDFSVSKSNMTFKSAAASKNSDGTRIMHKSLQDTDFNKSDRPVANYSHAPVKEQRTVQMASGGDTQGYSDTALNKMRRRVDFVSERQNHIGDTADDVAHNSRGEKISDVGDVRYGVSGGSVRQKSIRGFQMAAEAY